MKEEWKMARPKKDSKTLNCNLASPVYENLEQISKLMGKQKTTIIEDALQKYFSIYQDGEGQIKGIRAIFKDTQDENEKTIAEAKNEEPAIVYKDCIALEDVTVYGNPYKKILVNGKVLKVPSKMVQLPSV